MVIKALRNYFVRSYDFVNLLENPQAFKTGDELRPEGSIGVPAKLGGPEETLDFSPGSFINERG